MALNVSPYPSGLRSDLREHASALYLSHLIYCSRPISDASSYSSASQPCRQFLAYSKARFSLAQGLCSLFLKSTSLSPPSFCKPFHLSDDSSGFSAKFRYHPLGEPFSPPALSKALGPLTFSVLTSENQQNLSLSLTTHQAMCSNYESQHVPECSVYTPRGP